MIIYIIYNNKIITILHYYLEDEFCQDNRLTMKALVTLEWGMNIPVLTKLGANLSDLQDKIKLPGPDTCAKPRYRQSRGLMIMNPGELDKINACM